MQDNIIASHTCFGGHMDVNPLGHRILLKHALLFPGFMAFFERFYFYVLKNL